jgi:DUF1365 family protein
MKSCIYRGRVRHRRFQPVENAFSYWVYMMYIDLGELPTLFRGRWLWSADRPAPAWFRRKDYLGNPDVPLDEAVRSLVEDRGGVRPLGPIRLLTHLRYFGYCFNPVSFYYCFDPSDRYVETIVAEITNTPWSERHSYVLTETMDLSRAQGKKHFQFGKDFHVSPFMAMDMAYDWRFVEPGGELVVHMENIERGVTVFDATMNLSRREITGAALAETLAFHPVMTWKVIAAIHWQALRLWWKRAPFYVHPSKRQWTEEVPHS